MVLDCATYLSDSRFSLRARVCTCLELVHGMSSRQIASVLGVAYPYLKCEVLPSMVAEGLIGRSRAGIVPMYHGRKLGRRFVREELARIENEQRAALDRLIATGRAKEGIISPSLEK